MPTITYRLAATQRSVLRERGRKKKAPAALDGVAAAGGNPLAAIATNTTGARGLAPAVIASPWLLFWGPIQIPERSDDARADARIRGRVQKEKKKDI